jgi:MOSC domain-containing protein YiiM/GNAT superfamily N-acetyltransferase
LEPEPRAELDSRSAVTVGRVIHVNVSSGGVPKLPVPGALVGRFGLEGDAQANPDVHGGPHRAVALFAIEAIRRVAAEGHPIAPGAAGENLTTEGVELAALMPGARLAFPSGLELEIAAPDNPCDTIRGSFSDGRSGRISILKHPLDSRMYARVLSEGAVATGDIFRVLPALHDSQARLLNLVERLETNERRFWLATWEAVGAAGADLRILDLGDAIACAAPGLPGRSLNGAYGLRMVPAMRQQAVELFRSLGVAGWMTDVEPPLPGLAPVSQSAVLGIEPQRVGEAPAVDGLVIREIGADEATTWESIVVDGFEMTGGLRDAWLAAAPLIARIPGMHLLLAEIDGKPAGAAGLYTRARVGGLAPAAVAPTFRGRGIHRALIAARASLAEAWGSELVTVQADVESTSEGNLLTMGFARLLVRDVYIVEPGVRAVERA